MAKEGLRRKLEEIQMSSYDFNLYQKYKGSVEKEIQQLIAIIKSLKAKEKERVWLKREATGDIDENRLVEGLLGENLVYKRRGKPPDQDPSSKKQKKKPKAMRFVLDVSGSMYRFNGVDGRLERCVEAALMIMEAFADSSLTNVIYSIVGHCGDNAEVPLVQWGKAPKNEAERLKVCARMIAVSQYCLSGDTTVEATIDACRNVARYRGEHPTEGIDEKIVFVISDANLRRYGITTEMLKMAMNCERKNNVECFAIFIAQIGDEAKEIQRKLPPSQSHVCLQTNELPAVLQTIFKHSVLK